MDSAAPMLRDTGMEAICQRSARAVSPDYRNPFLEIS